MMRGMCETRRELQKKPEADRMASGSSTSTPQVSRNIRKLYVVQALTYDTLLEL